MQLYSQYYIANYLGTTALDLMSEPADLDIKQKQLYQRLLESVSFIYGSQDLKGQVPIWWSVRKITEDQVGNARSQYEASAKSTLKKLEPKVPYYFILRDTSFLPVKLPAVGTALFDFKIADAISNEVPSVTLTRDDPDFILTSLVGNKLPLDVKLDNLAEFQTYSFTVRGTKADWPVTILPVSGTFKTFDQPTATVNLIAEFCPLLNLCPSGTPGLLNYTLDQACLDEGDIPNKLSASFVIDIDPVSFSGINYTSPQKQIDCVDCLPRPIVKFPDVNIALSESNCRNIEVSVSSLIPYQEYDYLFRTRNANWPIVLTPHSGTIRPVKTDYKILSSLTFCPSTVYCSGGTAGLMDYTLTQQDSILNKTCGKFAELEVVLTPKNCSGLQGFSDPVMTTCIDCIPRPKISLPDGPISLSNYYQNITASFTDLVPYQEYNYEFKSQRGNWPVVMTPITGTIKSSTTTYSIDSVLAFCPSTILCSGGTEGLLNYDLDKYSNLFDKVGTKFTIVELSLTPKGYNDGLENFSEPLTVSCKDCLPDINGPSLTIDLK